ncbi:hypothetical protein ONE63_006713 [Megalurothrips usitatus]|uniref:Uncharacterized protein n=1 Tax=Megalurothrips usitatus TaxID=439358 RepID=A0AAV7XV90_9NEOP|nr:hypothetical protein ONE63_006713 [Megalurothrips usitatus]
MPNVVSAMSEAEESTSGKRRRPVAAAATAKLQRMNEAAGVSELDLRVLLNTDQTGGKHILEGCEQSVEDNEDDSEPPTLSETQRNKVTEIIVKHLLTIAENPDHNLFPVLTRKIVSLFPCETEETYYIAPKSESPSQIHPKGKIPNRVRNEKSRRTLLQSFNNSSPAPSSSTSSHQSSVTSKQGLQNVLKISVNEDMLAAQRWLVNGRMPWRLVVEKWVLTAPIRFRSLFENNSDHEFVNKYILEDFRLLQKEASLKLHENWDNFVTKTLNLASRDVKDPIIKKAVSEARKIPKTPINQSEC